MSPPKSEPGGRLAKILTICFSILTVVVLFHLIGSLISPRNPSTSSALAPCDKTACQSLEGISTLPSTECKCPLTEAANPGLETKLSELLQISKANEVKLDTKVAQVLQAVQSLPAVPAVEQSAQAVAGDAELVDRYLTLMANTLTGIVYRRPPFASRGGTKDVPLQRVPFDEAAAAVGTVWPDVGHTMVGLRRLENIRTLLEAGKLLSCLILSLLVLKVVHSPWVVTNESPAKRECLGSSNPGKWECLIEEDRWKAAESCLFVHFLITFSSC
jgi:hypothetical protein